jgi:hypothetical protein
MKNKFCSFLKQPFNKLVRLKINIFNFKEMKSLRFLLLIILFLLTKPLFSQKNTYLQGDLFGYDCTFLDDSTSSVKMYARFSIQMNPIINKFSSGCAYLLFQDNSCNDIRTIFWEGPNGFLHKGGYAYPIYEEGEYCITIINALSCAAVACICVPKIEK